MEGARPTFMFQEPPNCPENSEQVKLEVSLPNCSFLRTEGPRIERLAKGQQSVCELLTNSDCQCRGASDSQVEFRKESDSFCDSIDDEINEPWLTSEISVSVVDTNASESPINGKEEDFLFSEPTWLKGDESVAVWVKWRGKWQAGIRCARADWPLSTLRAKPTHDRKKYFVMFFPHTKNYSWADTLLVQSINEFPQPIAHKTHKAGLKMVKDLTVARRFIMQKLTIDMLNVVDQLHPNALIEAACHLMFWKEFAMEASRCSLYSDFGGMLPKLQNSILQQYLNAAWMQHSFHSWVGRCQNAKSAESVELLKEELFDSILWSDINPQSNALLQSTLGFEWKTWKHDVMKWFSPFHSLSGSKNTKHLTSDNLYQQSLHIGRKRAKLEVRRAETHASLMETKGSIPSVTLETDPGVFNNQNTLSTLATETSKKECAREVPIATTESRSNLANKWNEIIVEAVGSEILHTNGLGSTPTNEMAIQKYVEPVTKNPQCIVYIEAKGRQCVRSAIDNDVYCCVHSRFLGILAKAEKHVSVDTPMCEGRTAVGTRCKHHAVPASSFCKKHQPHDETANFTHNTRKRNHENYIASEGMFCKDIVLANVEGPLEVDPISTFRGGLLNENPTHSDNNHNAMEAVNCVGFPPFDEKDPCSEAPKWHFLYCEKHLPSWLKRARHGKSRIISKEVFEELLRSCYSWEQKVHLHKACELFYRLFKSILSQKSSVPKEVQLQCALTEASKDASVGKFFTKLVHSQKENIKSIWGFKDDVDVSSLIEDSSLFLTTSNDSSGNENAIKCKICYAEYPDDQTLSNHWMENHKKEAQWLFRGYACAICLDSFTNKKLLETHVQERHHVQFVEQCLLLQCIPCGFHFGNMEELWLHVLTVHPVEFKSSKAPSQQSFSTGEHSSEKLEYGISAPLENMSENPGGFRKFTCRFCGLKFDLLPDLGRHHQAAHMGHSAASGRPPKRGVRYHEYRLKSGILCRPKFRKSLAAASYMIRSKATANLKRRIEATKSLGMEEITIQPHLTETDNFGRLAEHQCSTVAKILFSESRMTKPRPNNLDILSIARSACCKDGLKASLEEKYGILRERVYLKAAKLCSDYDIVVNWHQDGFICPRGCKVSKDQVSLSPLASLSNRFVRKNSIILSDPESDEFKVDESHYIINSNHLKFGSLQKAVVLCDDISFGKESIPMICVVDQNLLNSLRNGSNEQDQPWESFTYISKPILDRSLCLDSESLQLGCSCSYPTCFPESCDHVYLFNNDYDDAKDISGKPMRGRFPYDENGRIILEEGYLVYECNQMCRCKRSCPNRILQNGVRVKLEVFKTEKKGWAVRVGEAILRGTFVCEYIGEVIDECEAQNRRKRYGKEHCSYFFNVDARVNDMSRLIEGQARYVIDATRYGNLSRFINNSCSPNLVNYQVLVESMDCERAHIGLYASRDIALGEELTYNYNYELVPGEGCPCLCGSLTCRGRLY
ncbi:histone-lysine N-methyltransferase SUVR5-like [Arachis duranensis]|uniref:Histone-lysine N-methyltransferase SUVR5-like n=1 Tax=Arachis duranensis TaxID=130453 RepID=A0A6P4CEA7_ARADU|nr:histone-lysine N-methyltransferase SUVR5-like [Arachis duranensis]XP_015949660.1 histone-lysine N-methyltransferase SUVR5-like [Arachis duranensis]XP_052115770.1 histone-lysine N-methyltransferase SUVR5-like [Arachis duranensis]